MELDPSLLLEFRAAAIGAASDLRAWLLALRTDPTAAERINGLAHRMRGAAGAYGFPQVSEAAAKVEESSSRALAGRVRKLVSELDAVVVSLVNVAAAQAPSSAAPPPSPAPAPEPTPAAVAPPAPATPVPELAPERSRRILVAEDDGLTVALITDRLQRSGLVVDHRADGVEALAAASGTDYDVIVVDVKMPRLDGFSVVKGLRGSVRHAKTPILMLTALGGSQDVVRGFDLGVDDYMRKPFSPAELVARIERLIGRPAP